MIRYGIIVKINDVLEIEATKRRMPKSIFMQHLLDTLLTKKLKEIQNELRREFLVNPIGTLNGLALIDWFSDRFEPLLIDNIDDNKIFIGLKIILNGLVPVTAINQTITNEDKDQVNTILNKLGYGMYMPTIWLILKDDNGEIVGSNYISTSKI